MKKQYCAMVMLFFFILTPLTSHGTCIPVAIGSASACIAGGTAAFALVVQGAKNKERNVIMYRTLMALAIACGIIGVGGYCGTFTALYYDC